MSEFQSVSQARPIAYADENTRAVFVFRTYLNLLGAICSFAIIEIFLFRSGLAENIAMAMFSISWTKAG